MNNTITGKAKSKLPYMFQEKYKLEDVMLGKEATEYVKVISKSQGLKLQQKL